MIITLISLGAFVFGFLIGVFELGYAAGLGMLSVLGGFSIGVRFVLFGPGLLIHTYWVDWVIITLLGVLMFLLLLAKQRVCIVSLIPTCLPGTPMNVYVYRSPHPLPLAPS